MVSAGEHRLVIPPHAIGSLAGVASRPEPILDSKGPRVGEPASPGPRPDASSLEVREPCDTMESSKAFFGGN